MERALNGKLRTIVAKDGRETSEMIYDERTALSLLKMHRDNATEPARREAAVQAMSADDANMVRDKLLAKLKRVRIQLLGKVAADTQGWDEIGKSEPMQFVADKQGTPEADDGGSEDE